MSIIFGTKGVYSDMRPVLVDAGPHDPVVIAALCDIDVMGIADEVTWRAMPRFINGAWADGPTLTSWTHEIWYDSIETYLTRNTPQPLGPDLAVACAVELRLGAEQATKARDYYKLGNASYDAYEARANRLRALAAALEVQWTVGEATP